ncbi:13S globulin seed storage protein 1 [Sesamum alatum]|uniref:13S globulin seed storage protein 1 n=1 Tax=Sesamum alatum TaxID=300844 RepID=A0AAE2CXH8_9LAMI|nr:13S globulin seed storage protein 1 [Sesamum alatum]
MADATVYEGEEGGYYAWTGAKSPAIPQAKLGAGKLVLRPRSFALPHYADAFKIGYVAQGTCTVGFIFPNDPKEKVVIINKGDAIPVSMGAISWWFNGGDSDTTIIFLGESSQSYNPGQFDYFFLTGPLAALPGFSTEFLTKIYRLNESDSKKLANSQTNALVVKLGEEINMPRHSNCDTKDYVFNLDDLISSGVCGSTSGAHYAKITAENFPLLDKIGLSASLVRLEANSVLDPYYSSNGSHQIIYVTKGTGRIQIVGLNGTQALDASVQEGQAFVVPKFFAVAQLAGEHGMEIFCVSTSPRPVLGQLAGKESAWKALSLPVLQAALNVSPEFVELFKSKNKL